MAAFHFIISPPAKKVPPKKVEKVTEEIPRLTLAPFNCTPEIKFGELLVNSKATRSLIIYNPSENASFKAKFGNVDSDDRIFVNGSDIKLCEIHLGPLQEVIVEISWAPILSGYLRKTIRLYHISKNVRSFDVVLRGMAVNANNANNGNSKKLKETNRVNRLPGKNKWNSTITLVGNQKNSDAANVIRRQTYTIHGKENVFPEKTEVAKNTVPSSSPNFQKEMSHSNMLNENSTLSHFSTHSFPSYDSLDAPTKYSNFKSELEMTVDTIEDMNPINLRRSTALHSVREKDMYSSMTDKNQLEDSSVDSISLNEKVESLTMPDVSTPVRNDNFSDCLYGDVSMENNVEDRTFNFKILQNNDVFLTPQKSFAVDSLILSPNSKLRNSLSFLSKSCDSINRTEEPSFQSYKRDDLFFISPPRKLLNKRCKKTPEDPFPHRSGSSAISDRKKLLKTSFLSRKRISPSSALKNRDSRRISTFGGDNVSSIEKVKSRNPETLKQAFRSHCQINDPFLKQALYNEDRWVEKQECDIIKWMNSVLVPPFELSEETNEWTVNPADVWLKGRSDENSTLLSSNKVPPLYSLPQKLDILRRRKNMILASEPVKSVFQNLTRIVNEKKISVRDDRDLHADEGLKKKLMDLLCCYNPLWLRIGLEAVYNQEIALQPKAGVGGLGSFIRKKLLAKASVNKRNINMKHNKVKEVKENMLLIFLKLVYFLDQARIQKLIRHNRCLFSLTSNHKSSQELLVAFCADLVIGRRYVMKHLTSIDYIVQFRQTCVDEYNYSIMSLDDLRDGIRLTRLCEILFMEPDLSSKLRIPAVDIENKKHNVDVAMKVARSRCTIEGNITAEDIVLGNRVGSRMKTLSFLWQIIHNYLAPLYERAATKIQKWWRVRRIHRLLKNVVQRERERRATVIQATWKGYRVRKQLRGAIVERRRQTVAALTIQRRFRAYLLAKSSRNAFTRELRATVVLQSWYRGISARRKFVAQRNAAIIVQRWYRARKLTDDCRERFLALKKSAVFVQRLRRANVAALRQRVRYEQMKCAAVVIQRKYRSARLARRQRNYYVTLRMAAVCAQRQFRAMRATRRDRERFLSMRQAALTIQRWYRRTCAAHECRAAFLRRKSAAVTIQNRYRAYRLAQTERAAFLALRRSAIIVQRKYRATRLMREQRNRYALFRRCVLNVQRLRRANTEARKDRLRYAQLKRAAIVVQRQFRAKRAAEMQRRQFIELKSAVILVQHKFRAKRAMVVERARYLHTIKCTLFVQRAFRANRTARILRTKYVCLKQAAVSIQRRFRAQKAMKVERQRYQALRQSAVIVQRRFRAQQLMKLERNRYQTLVRSVVFVQRSYKAKLAGQCARARYTELRSAAILVQRKLRANRLMRAQRSEFLSLKQNASILQRRFRAVRLYRLQRNRYLRLRKAAVFVQRKFRANKIGSKARREYQTIKASAVYIQRWYRSVRRMREQRRAFNALKHHALRIQRRYRATKSMRVERQRFETLKRAVTTIQRRYRAQCAMRKSRNHYLLLRSVTVAIQSRYIVLRKLRAAHLGAANGKLLRPSQMIRIGPLKIGKFDDEQRKAFDEMLEVRAEYLKLKIAVCFVQAQFRMKAHRGRFVRLKSAAISVQLWWRSIRQGQLAIREKKENARRIERNAATKIQALWRGYSVRKKIILPVKPITVAKKENVNPDSKGTLAERYKRAIDHLKTSDMYNVITIALWNLETVTTFSAKLCEGVALEGIVPIIFSLISRGNRSEPSMELYRASFSILINLARYTPTKVILWDNMDLEEDVLLILHIMKMTHDKFLKKNDVEVFRNSATLLWLLCHDAHVAAHIAGLKTVQFQIQRMMDTLGRKCPCVKNPKSKRTRTLPKTKSNWYADPETRTFNDNCFAVSCIYNSLFHQ